MSPPRRPFRFTAQVPDVRGSVGEWRKEVRRIEDMGFSTVALADHFTGGYTLEPLVMLTAAAMETTRLRVQTAVLGNDYRHPVLTHRMAATLDVISEGRLELGIGAGWMRSDYDAAGLAYDRPGQRIDRLEESIAVLKGLFTGEPFTFVGDHFKVRDLVGSAGSRPAPASAPLDRRRWTADAPPRRSGSRHRRDQRQPRRRRHRRPLGGRRELGTDGGEDRLGP